MIKVKRQRWIGIGIWAFLFLFMFNMLNYFQPTEIAIQKAAFEFFTIIFMYYLTSLFLFPRYYKNSKNYLILSMFTILVLALFFLLIHLYVIPEFDYPDDKERPPKFFHFFRFFTTLGFSYFVSTSISLMNQATKYRENEKLLMEEKLQTELKLLKAQINPHFIFNALNNIYSLSFLKSENAPDSILKLSEMLRYVFYDCSKDKVQLSSEMKYVENFISFQQMKSEHKQNIQLNSEVGSLYFEIAPMLIIPFIENAFKYSRIEELEEAYVQMNFKKENDHLKLHIENSVPVENKVGSGSGMGIKNVEHRLQILYPQNHQLKLTEENDKFIVSLEIKIQE